MPLDPDRVQAIFLAAVETEDLAKRAEILNAQCADDAELRARVEKLLNLHDQSRELPDVGTPNFAQERQPTVAGPTAPSSGNVIGGRYRLLEEIGEGGMGTVWVAEQVQPVRRRVAIKLIKSGMDTRRVLSRFELERQALAVMDHPNIAKVLDGGVTDQGCPYFVMEYVKGVPITDYCDQSKVGVEGRLQLFVQVCQAVQHAHQKGIIHRDLKPSNILVCPYDGRPVPKVIDFGLAKAINQTLTEHTLYTAHGVMVGTPLYMSPEQAEFNNLDVDTRADIYSLGVILYELLTGTTPLDRQRFKDAAWQEIVRLIKEEEPSKPSTKLSGSGSLPSVAAQRSLEPAQLTRLVRGDLDWIVMKALEKERSRRYETANGLARDLERYLADEVVEARPPSAGYRLLKLVRRNRRLVGAVGLIALALVGGIGGTTWGMFRAVEARKAEAIRAEGERVAKLEAEEQKAKAVAASAQAQKARDRAERRFELAVEAIENFRGVVDGNLDVKNRPENEALRKALLQGPLGYYQKLRDDLSASGEASPEARLQLGDAYLKLAALNHDIGSQAEALKEFDEATSLFERLFREAPSEQRRKYRERLARTLAERGELQSNSSNMNAMAFESLHRSRELQEATIHDNPQDIEARKTLSRVLYDLAALEGRKGKTDSALSALQTSQTSLEEVCRQAPGDIELQLSLAGVHLKRGEILTENRGRLAEAQDAAQKALQFVEGIARSHPESVACKRELARAYSCLGIINQRRGAQEQALEFFSKQASAFEEMVRMQPTRSQLRLDQARALGDLASAQYHLGRNEEGLANLQKGSDLAVVLVRENPTNLVFKRALSTLDSRKVVPLLSLGRAEEALAAAESSATFLEEVSRAEPEDLGTLKDLAGAHYNCALLNRELGRLDAAVTEYKTALALRERLAQKHPDDPSIIDSIATTLGNIGVCQEDREQLVEARASYQRAVDFLQKLCAIRPDNASAQNHFARGRQNLGKVLTRLGKPEEALVPLSAAQEASERLANEHPGVLEYQDDVARGFQYLAAALARLGHVPDAEKAYADAIGVRERTLQAHPTDSPNLARLFLLFNERGDFERQNHQAVAAVASYRNAVKLIEGRSQATPEQLYDLAAVHAKLSRMGADSASGLKAGETRSEADQAIAVLDKAVGAGFRNIDQIRKDADFDSLRQRDDFKKLLQRLEPSPPPAPSSGRTGEASGHTGSKSSTNK
jgi:serine/threonine protein kinase/tetratricopeptide (TPR) repeat protein